MSFKIINTVLQFNGKTHYLVSLSNLSYREMMVENTNSSSTRAQEHVSSSFNTSLEGIKVLL
jgi:hypothetical protein